MVRREGRPRRAAQARKQGPDRKSLVKYVDRLSTGATRNKRPLVSRVASLLQFMCHAWDTIPRVAPGKISCHTWHQISNSCATRGTSPHAWHGTLYCLVLLPHVA